MTTEKPDMDFDQILSRDDARKFFGNCRAEIIASADREAAWGVCAIRAGRRVRAREIGRAYAADQLREIVREQSLFPNDGEDEIQAKIAAPLERDVPAVGATSVQTPTWRDHVVGAQELCDQAFPAVKFVVPGLFPEGVTLLVSRPKLGKSWMLLQVGAAIAAGVAALVATGEPAQGDVLYLSLEDKKRRVQRRMTVLFGARRECWPERLTIASAWRRLDQGGLQDLRDWCATVSKPTLVMVDTLKKVRPPKSTAKATMTQITRPVRV
jgi:hypothetical protein